MITEVVIPNLPESVPDATLLDWTKAVGDAVTVDEVLVELETDKVVLEVSAPASGVLTEIVKQTGETGVSGDVIAKIDTAAAAAPSAQPAAENPAAVQPAAAEAPANAHPAAGVPSPAAAKMMAEQGIEASAVQATGPGGRITKADVIAQAGSANTASKRSARADVSTSRTDRERWA